MKKIAVIYGTEISEIQKKALAVLSEFLLDYTYEYPMCISSEDEIDLTNYRCFFLGTKENNKYIKELSHKKLTVSEQYYIKVENDNVIIEGYDDRGILYGCVDFYNKYILKYEFTKDDRYCINIFENKLPAFEYLAYPAVQNRGIWTWGHVIYDYKSFLDNMVKLKLNHITIWNDYAPFNAEEIVSYAHMCGIKVIWGFSWCWDTDCSKISMDTLDENIDEIIEKYENEYMKIGGDGIYFQSFTELDTETINGVIIAKAVTDFVNKTSERLYKKYPNIELQFGLHAKSVKNKLEYIKNINPNIRIMWEDCGAFPFSYFPDDIDKFDETMDLVKQTGVLRGENDKFGAVTKGFTKLDWNTFEHTQGPLNIGVGSELMKKYKIMKKLKIWKYIQGCWFINADKAYKAVQIMAEQKGGDLYITPLVEDGLFEKNIMYPVALFAEMLWDCNKDLNNLINEVSKRSYVTFA